MKAKKLLLGFIILSLGLFFLFPSGVEAGFFKTERGAWTRQTEDVEENLYIAGGNVSVSGDVLGDVLAAGANVAIQGSTTADVMSAGGSLRLDGRVGEDVRLVGGNIMVSESVGGDLLAAAGSVSISPGVSIGADALVTGGSVIFDGSVAEDLRIFADGVLFNGQVEGDLYISASNIEIGEDAKIAGDLNYTSPKEARISEEAQIEGEIDYSQRKKTSSGVGVKNVDRFFGVFKVIKLVVTLISSLVIVLVFPKFSKKVATRGISKFKKSILVGFAGLVATPIAIAILFASFVGWMFGFLTLMIYLAMIVLAQIMTGIIVGSLASGYFQDKPVVNWQWTAGGVFLVWLLSLIPFVGWLIVFILFLVSFGVLCDFSYKYTIKMED